MTASEFWVSKAPQKLASTATAASAASRAACSSVNSTGGRIEGSLRVRGGSVPATAASSRAAASRRAPLAASQVIALMNHPK